VPLMEWREAWGRHGLVMFLARCRQRLAAIVAGVRHILSNCLWARPAAAHITGRGTDLLRRRAQLLAENALLRHQVVILRRLKERPLAIGVFPRGCQSPCSIMRRVSSVTGSGTPTSTRIALAASSSFMFPRPSA